MGNGRGLAKATALLTFVSALVGGALTVPQTAWNMRNFADPPWVKRCMLPSDPEGVDNDEYLHSIKKFTWSAEPSKEWPGRILVSLSWTTKQPTVSYWVYVTGRYDGSSRIEPKDGAALKPGDCGNFSLYQKNADSDAKRTTYVAQVDGLWPGETYCFRAYSMREDKMWETMTSPVCTRIRWSPEWAGNPTFYSA